MTFEKWLDRIAPDQPLYDAAAISLKQRIQAVSHFLPLAADRYRESTEYVHQLRVWCRRSGAAIQLYQSQVNEKEKTWFLKSLRRIRRSAGRARDLDVLLARHQERLGRPSYRSLRSTLRRARKKSQEPILASHQSFTANHKLERHAKRLSGRASPSHVCFQAWADEQFDLATADFYAQAPNAQPTIEQLHRFRVSGKNLRYKMEMLMSAFPSQLRTELYPLISDLQIELGDVNDHAVAVQTLAELRKSHDSKQLRKLIRIEERAMTAAVESFYVRWTPKRKRRFFKAIDRLCGARAAC